MNALLHLCFQFRILSAVLRIFPAIVEIFYVYSFFGQVEFELVSLAERVGFEPTGLN